MTTLGALFGWLTAGKAASGALGGGRRGSYRLRPLPKEEIYVFVKAIDNTKLVRVVDQKDWAASAGVAGSVVVASLLLIGLLLPGGVNLLVGHRMEALKKERAVLVNELRELRAKEAGLKSPDKLDEYAGDQFVTPAASAVVFAAPARGTVAALKR